MPELLRQLSEPFLVRPQRTRWGLTRWSSRGRRWQIEVCVCASLREEIGDLVSICLIIKEKTHALLLKAACSDRHWKARRFHFPRQQKATYCNRGLVACHSCFPPARGVPVELRQNFSPPSPDTGSWSRVKLARSLYVQNPFWSEKEVEGNFTKHREVKLSNEYHFPLSSLCLSLSCRTTTDWLHTWKYRSWAV